MLKAAKRAVVESLVVYGLIAFVGSLPEPVGYRLAVWTLPALLLAFFLYEWATGRAHGRG